MIFFIYFTFEHKIIRNSMDKNKLLISIDELNSIFNIKEEGGNSLVFYFINKELVHKLHVKVTVFHVFIDLQHRLQLIVTGDEVVMDDSDESFRCF